VRDPVELADDFVGYLTGLDNEGAYFVDTEWEVIDETQWDEQVRDGYRRIVLIGVVCLGHSLVGVLVGIWG
jgi:hypothetical protein